MMMSKNRNFTAISYPRTGKRGVPQQFPRRLYEMLEIESSAAATSNRCQPKKPPECSPDGDGVPLISWSETGRAFRITDVSAFAEKILPNYFRTSKFSSFQRNLNLYGFSKLRKGPDTDMYAHEHFLRGRSENLCLLHKLTTAADRRRAQEKLRKREEDETDNGHTSQSIRSFGVGANIVSPPASPQRMQSHECDSSFATSESSTLHSSAASIATSTTSTYAEEVVRNTYNISLPKLIETYQQGRSSTSAPGLVPVQQRRQASTIPSPSDIGGNGNKLVLLAMAMTSIADA